MMKPEARTPRVGAVQWTRLDDGAIDPTRAYAGDAGIDLSVVEDTWIEAQSYRDVRTGIAVAMPDGYYMRIVGRSSTFRKKGLMTVEGVIDAGFRGELFACVYNLGYESVLVRRGERLAQAIVSPFYMPPWLEVEELPESDRMAAGFGSSGS